MPQTARNFAREIVEHSQHHDSARAFQHCVESRSTRRPGLLHSVSADQ